METITEMSLTCAACGASRPASQAHEVPRPPCSRCGATAVAVSIGIAEELNIATSVSAGLKPGDQSLGWSCRWEAAQDQLARLLALRTEELSGKAVKDARDDLLAFYVRTFHIKDALKVEAKSLGLDKKAIEDAVTADPALALLGDLANRVKHHGKGRSSISGDVPEIGDALGVTEQGGWRLEFTIRHRGCDLDGNAIAQEAVHAWEQLLAGWGLI